LAELLKREEVIEHRITAANRQVFDSTLHSMVSWKILTLKDGLLTIGASQEQVALFACSLVWPMIDSYYMTLLFALSLLKNKTVDASQVSKRVQWLGEALFEDKTIPYFEACNQESIKNAVLQFIEMKVLQRTSVFL